jgi:hypothetical protein
MPAENANRGWQTRRGRRTTVCNLEGPDGRLDRRYLLPLLISFLALPALSAPEDDLPRRFVHFFVQDLAFFYSTVIK